MTFQMVILRDDIVGGILETREGAFIYRGPITAVKLEAGKFYVETAWKARLCSGGVWKKSDMPSIFVNALLVTPYDNGQGRVSFQLPYVGEARIYPKGQIDFDESHVEGLVPANPTK